jgi:hypothetical protein
MEGEKNGWKEAGKERRENLLRERKEEERERNTYRK